MYSFDYAVAYLAQEALCLGLILIMAIRMNRDVGAVDEIGCFTGSLSAVLPRSCLRCSGCFPGP